MKILLVPLFWVITFQQVYAQVGRQVPQLMVPQDTAAMRNQRLQQIAQQKEQIAQQLEYQKNLTPAQRAEQERAQKEQEQQQIIQRKVQENQMTKQREMQSSTKVQDPTNWQREHKPETRKIKRSKRQNHHRLR